MDRLPAMRTLACVADGGSFAAAARRLAVAPSVVTRRIADLERHLGARLLTRTTRRVALTAVGAGYLERVRRILHAIDDATAAARTGHDGASGRVRIVAPPVFAAQQLAPRLARLQVLHPGLALDVTASGPVEAMDPAYDIGIVVGTGAPGRDCVALPLATAAVVWCAAPAYLRRRGRPLHPQQLAEHALLVAVPERFRGAVQMTRHTSGIEVVPREVALRSRNAGLCLSGALAGLGLAALPSFAVQRHLQAGRLERVLADWKLFDLAVNACHVRGRPLPAAAQGLLDFLRAEFPEPGTDPWCAAPGAPRLAA
jgi:DNA-binding transcriptional LysR family regulator